MWQMPAESLISFVRTYAAAGDEVAIRQQRGYRMQSWSYACIARTANAVARELQSRGLRKGDSVLLWGENSAEWIASFFGCLLCGVVIVPIDDASNADFACRVAREVNAKLIFKMQQRPKVCDIPSIPLESLTQIGAKHETSVFPSPPLSRQDTLEIIFTSGTTAEPRGVVLSHGNVLANIEPIEKEIRKYLKYERFFHPIRFLDLLPLSHVFGQMLGVFIPPLLGGAVVFSQSQKPSELIEISRRERISVMVAVPRFIESLQREVERQQERRGASQLLQEDFAASQNEHFLRRWWRFRRIRSRFGWKFWAFISGGAALPEPVETFWTRLGYAVIQGYGMTETTSLISLNHPFQSTKGSIGKVFPGMEVRVDENGEILVRGENVARTYQQFGTVASLAEADGWFRTGDIAEKDAQGRLYFRGRRKNVIVTPAGMNIYPEDLEKELRNQPEVQDSVVIGLERDGNAEPYAVLLMNGTGVNAKDVVARANQSLAEYQKIRHWFVWPDADFPRTPTQKPVLPRIREVVAASTTAAAVSKHKSMPLHDSLTGLIERITGRTVQKSGNTNLESDLGLSSLDRVELMSAIEERYQVQLNEVQFSDAATLDQLEQLLAAKPAARIEHVYPTWPQRWLPNLVRLAVYYLLAWPATYLLAAPRIHGREHLRSLNGPVLIVSNHVTYLDIAWVLPALTARFRNRLATAMRGERLAEMRRPSKTLSVFERFMEHLRYFLVLELFNVFPLPRQSGFLQSFQFAGTLADRGWNTLIFPEGQTSIEGKIMPFQSGVGLLAKYLNIPVLPIYLGGALFELKQENRILARPGTVHVNIGAPVKFAPERDPNEIAHELERRVRELQFI
jgi:long-chain acyl-CoA synthetase